MRRIAEDAYVTLPAPDRAAFAAYTRGVNQFIATHLNNLPVEFTLLNYQPRPWSVVDCLLLCLHMYRNLTTTWKDEIVKNNLLAQGDRAKVEFLYPMRGLGDASPGSNAWALAGSRTASGKPLLSSDMHLEYSLPGIWYMTHLEAPGLDVGGRRAAGRAGHHRRAQPADRLGHHQPAFRRAGSLPREVRRSHRTLPFPRPGGAGARRARDHPRQGAGRTWR